MQNKLHIARYALAAGVGAVCLFVSDNWSSPQQSSLITQADARIGRPLTPLSVAGVARRQTRRAYRGAYYGAAAVGVGAAAAAYYGSGYYGDRYAGNRYYGDRYYGDRYVGNRYVGDGNRYYAGGYYGNRYQGAGPYYAYADGAYSDGNVYQRSAWTSNFYPTRAMIKSGSYPVSSYYGPLCRPRVDGSCQ